MDGDIKYMLRQCLNAIESGKQTKDHRGVVFTQEFGEKFVEKIKNILDKE